MTTARAGQADRGRRLSKSNLRSIGIAVVKVALNGFSDDPSNQWDGHR